MRTSTLGLLVLGCLFWIGADAGSQPVGKKPPATAPPDLLQQFYDRQEIEEQRIAAAVDDAIRQADRAGEKDSKIVNDRLKKILATIHDNPEINEKAREVLVARVQTALRQNVGSGPKLPFKKPSETAPVVRRWEYHIHHGLASKDAFNNLGADGWELVAVEPSDRKSGINAPTYIFRRPATGKPKPDEKAAADSAPKGKEAAKLEVRIYRLKFAAANEMAQILDDVLRPNKYTMRIAAEPRSNQIIVNATIDAHVDIEALVQRLDVPAEADRAPQDRPPFGGFPPGGGKKKK